MNFFRMVFVGLEKCFPRPNLAACIVADGAEFAGVDFFPWGNPRMKQEEWQGDVNASLTRSADSEKSFDFAGNARETIIPEENERLCASMLLGLSFCIPRIPRHATPASSTPDNSSYRVQHFPEASHPRTLCYWLDERHVCILGADAKSNHAQRYMLGISAKQYRGCPASLSDEGEIESPSHEAGVLPPIPASYPYP